MTCCVKWYDPLTQDLLKADSAREEDELIHEVNLLRSDIDSLEHRNADKKIQIDKLNSIIHSLRKQLQDLDDDIRDLNLKLRSKHL
jgi:peptidoglycan hydrolase CwlO-like protein